MLIGMHILVGAGLGTLAPHPALSFALGAASHFAGDAIPHWEYSIEPLTALSGLSRREKFRALLRPAVLRVLGILFCEILGAFALALWMATQAQNPAATAGLALAGGMGGFLPDVLWGLAGSAPRGIVRAYVSFHAWTHTTVHNVGFARGFTWQAVAALAALALIGTR